METFKIENFQRDNPGRSFPRFEHLSPSQCQEFRNAAANTVGLDPHVDSLTLIRTMAMNATPVADVNAEQDGFDLSALVIGLGISFGREVFINWHRFDDIDQMSLQDLSTHFDAIWYPGPDDVEIFDSSVSWFLLVSHDGAVSLLRPRESRH
jgi:hypothetical protein